MELPRDDATEAFLIICWNIQRDGIRTCIALWPTLVHAFLPFFGGKSARILGVFVGTQNGNFGSARIEDVRISLQPTC